MFDELSPSQFRNLCKQEKFTGHTSGCLPGYAQANVIILPQQVADDFTDFCERNPVACPLLGKTILGFPNKLNNHIIEDETFDLRTDLPKYRIHENGKFTESYNCLKEWDVNSYIGFLIGCSFSFENALCKSNLPPRNVTNKSNVSMYDTKKRLNPAGVFTDVCYVVSMRPYKLSDLETVRTVTRKFKQTHGEPIDWGYDAVERLGITDITKPEYGDACVIKEDEIPVFWACGVTTQVAALEVGKKHNFKVFSHSPGHMLVLDVKNNDMSSN